MRVPHERSHRIRDRCWPGAKADRTGVNRCARRVPAHWPPAENRPKTLAPLIIKLQNVKRPRKSRPLLTCQSVLFCRFAGRRCCPLRTRQRLPSGWLRRGATAVVGLVLGCPSNKLSSVRLAIVAGLAVRLALSSGSVNYGRRPLAILRYRCALLLLSGYQPVVASAAVGQRYSARLASASRPRRLPLASNAQPDVHGFHVLAGQRSRWSTSRGALGTTSAGSVRRACLKVLRRHDGHCQDASRPNWL